MAKPVKDTPVLNGKSSSRFQKIIERNAKRKVPKSDYDRAKAAYKNLEIINGSKKNTF